MSISLSNLATSVSASGKTYESRVSLQKFLDAEDLDFKVLPSKRSIAILHADGSSTDRLIVVSNTITEMLKEDSISYRKLLQCEIGKQISSTGETYFQMYLPAKSSSQGVLAALAAGAITHDDLVG